LLLGAPLHAPQQAVPRALVGPVSLPAPSQISSGLQIHYSPVENLEAIDVGLISQARSTIDIAAYVLTDVPVIEALLAASERGVAVRLYLDGSGRPAGGRVEEAVSALFSAENVAVRVKPPQSAIMHLKGYVVDGKLLRTGSANFSASGLKHQDNDLIALTDPHFVRAFEDKFEAMWEREGASVAAL